VTEAVSPAVQATKKSQTSSDEKLTEMLTSLPGPITRFVVWAIITLDYFGLLPASFIKGDAFHSSAFLANLGSIGLDAVFHHMYEWGNTPFFVVIGKRKKEQIVNDRGELAIEDVLDMTFSVDERITDGVYYAGAISLFIDLIENPEKLEVPPENLPDPFALA
jgi:2-oxoacid dehydrogenases acyltransferase (catalytic domain)